MVDEATNLIMEQLTILRRGQEAFQRGQDEMRVADEREEVVVVARGAGQFV